MILPLPCDICGALIGRIDVHQDWHDGLAKVVRQVMAPELSDEEWDEQMAAGYARNKERFGRATS